MPEKNLNDDPWADLYADLGVTERPIQYQPAPVDDVVSSADVNADDDDENNDDEAESGVVELDEDGNPKKRKRRRRRRSKKKSDDTAAPHAGDDGETVEPELTSEDGEVDQEAEAIVPALEGGTSEMTREMIANWNVPSWDEIVAGLYRPER